VHGADPRYRADVDGLRAIAVVAVLAFHAWPPLLPGGFAGVDIFFVISGYLITGVIAGDLAAGRFTLASFYQRRVRRIFPALAAMLVTITLAAWAVLLPDEWRSFGKHLFAGAAFVSNLALAREGDYFDWGAHFKPLLHLWSLGVEEQFYFVWPLFVALLWKRGRRVRIFFISAALLVSFALNVLFIARHATMTFYLPVTRLWELAIGSALSVATLNRPLPRRAAAEVASWSGVALLVATAVALRESHPFPGAWALLPTIGTALLIAAGPLATFNRHFLANRAVVFVGLISYPLYLWHWPLLSLTRIVAGRELTIAATSVCLIAAFALACCTYWFVERPIRKEARWSPRVLAVCAVMALLAAAGLAFRARLVLPRLSGSAIEEAVAASSDWNYPFGLNFGKTEGFVRSTVKGTAPGVVLFVGDSHLEHYWARFDAHARDGRAPEMRFTTNGGCPPLPGLAVARGEVCRDYLDFALREARDPAVTKVVFGAHWALYLGREPARAKPALDRLGDEIRDLRRRGKTVFLILASPESEHFDPRSMVSRRDGHITAAPASLQEILTNSGPAIDAVRATATRAGAVVLDPLPAFCPRGICPSVTIDGRPLYRDWSHLRPFTARERATFLDRIFE
jgi:peptidoglycan/LPS O-acetylase OafA/YrhL